MEIDSFLDLVKKRRSIRRFRPDPIPDEYVEKILEAARWAMSGANGQPWEFVVVRNPETRAKIVQAVTETRGGHLIEESRLEELRHPGAGRAVNFGDAPVIIVVCGDPRTFQATHLAVHFLSGEWDNFHMSLGNATHNIHLAAAALGLGAQWVTLTKPLERELKDILKIPEIFRIYVMIPIGYRAYEPAPSYRRELSEIVHYDSYDESKYRSDEDIRDFIIDLRRRTKPTYKNI